MGQKIPETLRTSYKYCPSLSAGVASINFLCTFIGLFLVERIGRRRLLLWSLLGVVVALGFLGGGFLWSDSRDLFVQCAQSVLPDGKI